MLELPMEIRSADPLQRLLIGVVAPYDTTTYLVPVPGGERIRRGAFKRSIDHRSGRIPLYRNHDRTLRYGAAEGFTETPDGLVGTFRVNPGDPGDDLLDEVRNGYYGGLSAGFESVHRTRAADGSQEITEGRLHEVSVVGHPAYESAGMLEVRNAERLSELLAPFQNRPDVNLDPIPPLRYGPR